MARFLIRAAASSRAMGVSFLESSIPMTSKRRGNMTAAATTGPASGPRPASSTPAHAALILSRLSIRRTSLQLFQESFPYFGLEMGVENLFKRRNNVWHRVLDGDFSAGFLR